MKLDDVVFLDEADIHTIHEASLARWGGIAGVREPATVSAAANAPEANARNGYLTTLAEIAATYAFGFARTQAFADGNKRTAFGSMTVFLGVNGYPLKLDPDTWERIMLDVAEKRMSRNELAKELAAEMGDWCPID